MRRILFSMAVAVGLSAVVWQSVHSQSQSTEPSAPSGQRERKARPTRRPSGPTWPGS